MVLFFVVVQWVINVCATPRPGLLLAVCDWLVEGNGSAGSFDLLGWSSRGYNDASMLPKL